MWGTAQLGYTHTTWLYILHFIDYQMWSIEYWKGFYIHTTEVGKT